MLNYIITFCEYCIANEHIQNICDFPYKFHYFQQRFLPYPIDSSTTQVMGDTPSVYIRNVGTLIVYVGLLYKFIVS